MIFSNQLVRQTFAVLAVLLIAGISFIATVEPGVFGFLGMIPYGDKIGHFMLFGFMTCAVITGFRIRRNGTMWCVSIVVGLVVVEEFLQL